MNTKVVYAAGIVILIIGIVFYFVNTGVSPSGESTSPSSSASVSNDAETGSDGSFVPASSSTPNTVGSNYENLTLSPKSVDILSINDIPTVQIALDVHNPNRGAAILETIRYNVYYDNVKLVSADIGAQPEGFIESMGSVYTIIGDQTITLRDRQPLSEEGISLLNSNGTLIQNSNSSNGAGNNSTTQTTPGPFIINGTFATSLHRGSEAQASDQQFSLQFPEK